MSSITRIGKTKEPQLNEKKFVQRDVISLGLTKTL